MSYLKIPLIFGVLLLIISCNKWADTIDTKIIGHGATGLQIQNAVYHDNSREGIQYTNNLPFCKGVEVDLRLDTDGEIWLYHDDDLATETNGVGCISNLTTAYLNNIYYSTFHKEALFHLNAEQISVFEDKHVFFDLKPLNVTSNVILDPELFKSKILALGMDTANFGIIVPNLTYFHNLKNDFQVYLSIESVNELTSAFLDQEDKCRGLVIRNKNISKEEVNFFKSIHKEVIIFDVRSPKGIKSALLKNPTFLLSDDVKIAIGFLH